MDDCHGNTALDVEAGGERGGGKHGHDRHAVHMVAYGFAAVNAEAAPAFALGGLEALKNVEEWKR